MLTLLLALSVSGQLLPCVHVGSAQRVAAEHVAQHEQAMDMSMDMAVDGPMDMPMQLTTNMPLHHHGAPSSNHAPAAPGCAQLMACGLVVQVAAVTSSFDASQVDAIGLPTGLHLQYATADREVESPPPRG